MGFYGTEKFEVASLGLISFTKQCEEVVVDKDPRWEMEIERPGMVEIEIVPAEEV